MKQITDCGLRIADCGFPSRYASHTAYCLLLTAFCLLLFSACSIPNLESGECIESKSVVKKLYSYHFGNDMKFTPENLKQREEYLSAELRKDLAGRPESAVDYFTQTDDYPKAFRIGKCEVVGPDRTVFDVLIFWRTDTRTEERHIKVEAVKENGQWLVGQVSSEQ